MEKKNGREDISMELPKDLLTQDTKEVQERIYTKFLQDFVDRLPTAKKFSGSIFKGISYVIEYDIAFQHALNKLKRQNKKSIIFNDEDGYIKSVSTRISRLLYLDLMIQAAGLSAYRDLMMENTIDILFKPVNKEVSGNRRLIKLLEKLEVTIERQNREVNNRRGKQDEKLLLRKVDRNPIESIRDRQGQQGGSSIKDRKPKSRIGVGTFRRD